MIRVTDATRLASTKLRTRKVRLVVTIVIAGLLFTVLAAASQVSRGTFASLAGFNREGFGERYILAATPQTNTGPQDPASLPEVVARAEAIQKNLVAQKTAEAKRLGIDYDPKSEPPVVTEYDGPGGRIRGADPSSVAGKQAIAEYYKSRPSPGPQDLKRLADPYQPTNYYQSKSLGYGGGGPVLKVLEGGKEKYEIDNKEGADYFGQRGLGSFTNSWGLMSQDLFKPFMLPNANTAIGKDGSIPVIAPYTAIEQLLGLKELPESTESKQRLERIKQVRSQAADVSFEVCYRNTASQSKLQDAISQQKEIAANKGKKDYIMPTLVYGLPQKPCGPVVIQSDKRTAADKTLMAKQEQFDRKFSGQPEAQQQTMKFRVIGIAPDPPDFSASVVSTLVSTIVSSNLSLFGPTWFTPIELEKDQPLLKAAFSVDNNMWPGMSTSDYQYVELASAQAAKDFSERESCEPDFSAMPMNGPPDASFDPYADCAKQGKYFGFMPFGSNAMALEDVRKGFNKVFGYAAIAVAFVAAIIMVGTVGRTIADSRRETAVFRAIGAKKIDIVLVYLIYAFFLSFLIYGFALVTGFGIAQLVHARYSEELTIQALVSYNAADLNKVFNLYSFYVPDMVRLLGLSLAGGALSAFFPLLRNLRRNPIRDMRDET